MTMSGEVASLSLRFQSDALLECGCDEAGRGPLAGDVFAAAVILPEDFFLEGLNDSKKISERKRLQLRPVIEQTALAWGIGRVSAQEIDELNILRASFLAMHRAIDAMALRPDRLLIDGNRFTPYRDTPHHCIVKGDAKFMAIAAASILAKTYRDEYMQAAALRYPGYGWEVNKGYPTPQHRKAIKELGLTPLHRLSFTVK